jgi:phosphatidylglycerophosphate synthase
VTAARHRILRRSAGRLQSRVVGIRDSHPFPRFGPANWVTAVRAGLVALLAGLIVEPAPPPVMGWATAVAALAASLDGVDGWLARRTRMESAFGARFDLETDALLTLVLALLAWRHDKAGAWVVLSGLLRYLFVGAGWLWRWVAQPLPSSLRRKTVCVIQIVGLILVIAPPVSPPLSGILAAVALAALIWSFAVDLAWLWRHAATRLRGVTASPG